MKKKNISLIEKETSVDIDYVTKEAVIYTNHIPLLKLLYNLIHTYPSHVKLIEKDDQCITVSLPSRWIGIRKPKMK